MTGQDRGPGRVTSAPLETRFQPRKRPELVLRLVSAVVLALLALAAAWAGGPVFSLFWLLAGLSILWEWQALVRGATFAGALVIGGLALTAAVLLAGDGRPASAAGVLCLGAAATALIARDGQRLAAACGPLYAGALVVSVPLLRHSDRDGLAIILWLFAVVWGTDTLAYVGGSLIGGPKLAPRLSPSKTWSGFLIGISFGAAFGLMVAPAAECRFCLVAAGLCGGAVAQAGDLFESALKRRYGAKDSGSLIPGHGGVMDRLDGFIAASVFAAGFGLWRFGPLAAGSGLLKW